LGTLAAMTDQTFASPEAPGRSISDARAGFWARFGAAIVDGILVGLVTTVLDLALKGPGYAIGFLATIAYYVYCEGGERGQTIGKAALGIQVRSTAGGPIGYGRGFLRYVGRILSTIPLLLGYFWMLWDSNKQTWHDKIANSVVVPVRR
jgi:uncharacterized RDD family membrane protein YckC